MYKDSTDTQMSELEQEFELEMDHNLEFETSKSDEDSEHEDYEFEDYENEDYEMEDNLEMEDYEGEPQQEFEWLESNDAGYGERFFELSQREFESESEVDAAVNELLTEMENEYFFGGLLKKAKNAAIRLAQKGVDLARKAGINIPSFGALKSMLGPLTGLLKGQLGTLIGPALKTALAAHPAGLALLPALKGLGFESSRDMDGNREAYDRFAAVAREAFENLAENLNENADHSLEASRLATNAFQNALKKHQKPGFGENQFGARYNTASVTNQVGTRRRKGRRIYSNNDIVIVVFKRKRR